jgi:putative ABC transport system permease protein
LNRQGGTTDLSWEGKPADVQISFTDLPVGYDFLETLNIKLKEGRSFSRGFMNEKSKIIFNEKAIEMMGLKDPIGKVVHLWGEDRQIIGVVKNFHFKTLYEDVTPLFFDFSLDRRVSKIIVKIEPQTSVETVERLKEVYSKFYPGLAFEPTFLESDYALLYNSENRAAGLSKLFAIVAIVLSCLGLFGLATYTAERRTKEISIRKLMGLNEWGVATLLLRYFATIMGVSIVIALPISLTMTENWLDNFAYRINLSPWHYLQVVGIILLTGTVAVLTHTLKASRTNPVETLKVE